jgi:serine/threonine protein phosphatase PrpC
MTNNPSRIGGRGSAFCKGRVKKAKTEMLNVKPGIKVISRGQEPFITNAFALTQGKRPSIEDYDVYLHDENMGILIAGIADGHGGNAIAEWYHAVWPSMVVNMLRSAPIAVRFDTHQFASLLGRSIYISEQNLFNHWARRIPPQQQATDSSASYTVPSSSGTTLSVCVWYYSAYPRAVFTLNVGDSQTFIFNQQGIPLGMTPIYSPNEPNELARIEAAGCFVQTEGTAVPRVNGILALSRALGDFQFKIHPMNGTYLGAQSAVSPHPSISCWPLLPDERYYVFSCSDGLFENEAFTLMDLCKSVADTIKEHEIHLSGSDRERDAGGQLHDNNLQQGGCFARCKASLLQLVRNAVVKAESKSFDNISCQMTCIVPSLSHALIQGQFTRCAK